MNCDLFKEELGLSFGGSLTSEQLEHLNSCESCKAFQVELDNLTGSLGDDSSFYLTKDEIENSISTIINNISDRNKKKSALTEIIPNSWMRPLTRVAAILLIFSVTYSSYLIGLSGDSTDTGSTAAVNGSIVETTYVTLSEGGTVDEMDDEMISILIDDLNSSSFFGAGELLLDDLTDDEMEYLKNNLSVGDIL